MKFFRKNKQPHKFKDCAALILIENRNKFSFFIVLLKAEKVHCPFKSV